MLFEKSQSRSAFARAEGVLVAKLWRGGAGAADTPTKSLHCFLEVIGSLRAPIPPRRPAQSALRHEVGPKRSGEGERYCCEARYC